MDPMSFVDAIPLWLLNLLAAGLVLLSIELGWRLGDRTRLKSGYDKDAPIGAAVGATLGLLAFLLAFTFGMAASRFDTRKLNVLQEANAIGTTYLRADLIPPELGTLARDLLREYAAWRSGGEAAVMSAEGVAKSATLHDQLWSIAVSAKQHSDTVSTGLFTESLNQMIDVDGIRVAGLRNRLPDTIWLMLGLVTFFSMAAMGYQFGLTGKRNWAAILLLIVTFTTVIVLIADLDRPQAGLLQVSQQPIFDVLSRIGTPVP